MAGSTRKPRAGAGARRGGSTSRTGDDVPGPDLRNLARDAALAALTRLAELANSEDERVALAASQELLNRAFGKSPTAASDEPGGSAQPLVIKIVRFGAEVSDEPSAATQRQPASQK